MTNDQIESLLLEIEKTSQDKAVLDFVRKFRIWRSFFRQILEVPHNAELPKNHAVIFALRLVVLCGMAESYEKRGGSDAEKVANFLNILAQEEKLLFSLAFEIKDTNTEHYKKFEEYAQTKDPALLDETMELKKKEDEKYDRKRKI
jgi:hypothetical protein